MESERQSKGTVLFVESDLAISSQVENWLGQEGYQIATASTVKGGLELLQSKDTHLILIDLECFETDVFELSPLFKKEVKIHDVPLIYVSSFLDAELKKNILKSGAADYLQKPLEPEVLKARVGTHVALFQARQKIQDTKAWVAEEVRLQTEQIRQQEERYRTVVDFAQDWVYWVLPDGDIAYMSPSVEKLTGYTVAEFEQNPDLLNQIIHPDSLSIWDKHIVEHSTQAHKSEELTLKIKCKDGGLKWIGHVCGRVYDAAGAFCGVRVANRDITSIHLADIKIREQNEALLRAKKKLRDKNTDLWGHLDKLKQSENLLKERNNEVLAAEEELRASNDALKLTYEELERKENLLKATQELARLGDIRIRIQDKTWTGSEHIAQFFHTPFQQVYSLQSLYKQIHSAYLAEVQQFFEDPTWGESDERQLEFKVLDAAKKQDFWVHSILHVQRDDQGEPEVLWGSMQDITKRKKAELEKERVNLMLQKEQEVLRLLLNNVPATICFKDKDSRFTRINEALANLLGLDNPVDAIGKNDRDFFTDTLAEQTRKDELEIMRTGLPILNKIENLSLDPEQAVWVSTSKVPLYNSKGEVEGVLGINHDVTEMIDLEKQLQASKERFELAMQASSDGVWDWNLKSGEIYYSHGWKKMLGYADEELGNDLDVWRKLCKPGQWQEANELASKYIKGEIDRYETEFTMQHKEGHDVNILSRGTIVRDADGEPVRFVGTHMDLTAVRAAEERFKYLSANIPDIIMSVEDDYSVSYANKTLYGNLVNEIIGKNVNEVFSDETFTQSVLGQLQQAFQEKKAIEFEAEHLFEFAIYYFNIRLIPIKNAGKASMLMVINDITEKKRNELALAHSEESLRYTIEHTSNKVGQAFFDEITRSLRLVTHSTHTFIATLKGDEIQTLSYHNTGGLQTNFTCSLKNSPCEEVIAEGTKVYPNSIQDIFPDDEILCAKSIEGYVGTPILNQEGQCTGLLVSMYREPMRNPSFVQSIFEVFAVRIGAEMDRLKSEEALKLSNDIIQSIIRVAPTGIGLMRNFIFNEVNPKVCEMTGYTEDELLNQHVEKVFYSDVVYARNRINMSGQVDLFGTGTIETKWRTKDGKQVDVLLSVTPLDMQDRDHGLIFTVLDITKRKRVEAEMQKVKNMLEAALTASPAGIMIVEKDGLTPRFINKAVMQLKSGMQESNMVIPSLQADFLQDWVVCHRDGTDMEPEEMPVIQAIQKNKIITNKECIVKDAMNQERVVLTNAAPIYDNEGKVVAGVAVFNEITEMKKAEQEIQEREERFRMMFYKNMSIMLLIDPESGQIIDSNAAAQSFYGYSKERLEKMRISDINTLDEDEVRMEMNNALKERMNFFRFKHQLASGDVRYVNTYSSPIHYKNKTILYSIVQDVTEQHKARKDLLESEHNLKLIFDNSPAIMMLVDEKAQILMMNQTGLRFADVESSNLTGMGVGDTFNCIHNAMTGSCGKNTACEICDLRNAISHTILTGQAVHKKEVEILRKIDGQELKHIMQMSSVVATTNAKMTYLITLDDITERKNAELALADSLEKFKTLADYTYDWEYWEGPDHSFIYISPACYRVTGYKPEEFHENSGLFESIILPEDRIIWEKHQSECTGHNDKEVPVEFRIKTKRGKVKWIAHVCKDIYSDGVYMGNRGTNSDVSMRKKSELDLRNSENRFKQLANLSFEAILIHEDGIIRDVNRAFTRISGYKPREVIGKDLMQYVDIRDHQLVLESMAEKVSKTFEMRVMLKNGQLLQVEVNVRNFSSSGDKRNLRGVSLRDITEQKQMQQRILTTIIQTEEGERKRVAQELHDGLGPVLSTVKLYTQTYINTKDSDFRKKIEDQLLVGIDDALQQVSSISNNLSPHVLNDFGIKVAIEKFIEKIQRVKPIHVQYRYEIESEIEKEIETTIYRVIIELMNNTVKHANAKQIRLLMLQGENFIHIKYKDDGVGFDLEQNKEKGIGMGLFNIFNRVDSFGGSVVFESKPDQGCTYEIEIPTHREVF